MGAHGRRTFVPLRLLREARCFGRSPRRALRLIDLSRNIDTLESRKWEDIDMNGKSLLLALMLIGFSAIRN